MLDLFSGLGGASRAMREAGWTVIRVDIEEKFSPDICCDIRDFKYSGPVPDLVWASPPCTEFSKLTFPWLKDTANPDVTLALETKRVIIEANPTFWVVENVRGAVPYFNEIFGKYTKKCGAQYLWGRFPICDPEATYGKAKGWKSAAERAVIPYQISKALQKSCEAYI